MKPFRFTLQALQTVRVREERFALERYAEAVNKQRQAATRLDKVNAELLKGHKALHQQRLNPSAAGNLYHAQAYCQALQERRAHAHASLMEQNRVVANRLEEMMVSRQKRMAVDACQDQQKRRYDQEVQRMEHRLLDEMAARRFGGALRWRHADVTALS